MLSLRFITHLLRKTFQAEQRDKAQAAIQKTQTDIQAALSKSFIGFESNSLLAKAQTSLNEAQTLFGSGKYTEAKARAEDASNLVIQAIQAEEKFKQELTMIIGIIVAVIIVVTAVIISRKRRKPPSGAISMTEAKSPPATPSPPREAEPKSPSETKLELEHERITEMLNGFEKKFRKGEIPEKSYERLKSKYEAQLKEVERKIAQG